MSGTLVPPTAPGGPLPDPENNDCGHGYRDPANCPTCQPRRSPVYKARRRADIERRNRR